MLTRWVKNALIASLTLSLFACSFLGSSSAPSSADIEKEEQAVYSFFVSGGEGPVLILQDTDTGMSTDDPKENLRHVKSGLPSLSKETADSFLQRNQQASQLSPDMQLGVNYVLLSTDELSQITSQPNWNEVLSEKYPGSQGYTIFSRVGLNQTLDQALIYVGNVAAPLTGAGHYYLLEKEDGKWLIKEQAMVWIS